MAHSLSYTIDVNKITSKKRVEKIQADADECSLLAERLKILEVTNLSAELILQRKGDLISMSGSFTSEVVQECVATLKPVHNQIEDTFEIVFYDADKGELEGIKVEYEEFHDNVLDIGDVIIQQLALALPSYPKADGVEFFDHIEEAEPLETTEKETYRPFETLLKGVTATNDEKDKE